MRGCLSNSHFKACLELSCIDGIGPAGNRSPEPSRYRVRAALFKNVQIVSNCCSKLRAMAGGMSICARRTHQKELATHPWPRPTPIATASALFPILAATPAMTSSLAPSPPRVGVQQAANDKNNNPLKKKTNQTPKTATLYIYGKYKQHLNHLIRSISHFNTESEEADKDRSELSFSS